jgi:hypothetical protein
MRFGVTHWVTVDMEGREERLTDTILEAHSVTTVSGDLVFRNQRGDVIEAFASGTWRRLAQVLEH